jgi:hypothetical protein
MTASAGMTAFAGMATSAGDDANLSLDDSESPFDRVEDDWRGSNESGLRALSW